MLFATVIGMITGLQVFIPQFVMTQGGPVDATLVLTLDIYDTAFFFLDGGKAAAMSVVLFGIIALITLFQFWVYSRGSTTEAIGNSVEERHGNAPLSTPSRLGSRIGHVLLYAALIAGAVLILLPFAYMLSTSLKSLNEVFSTPVQWIPEELKWENFSTPLREHPIDTYFKNSLIVAVSVTLLNLLTCSLAGYSFAKFTYPGRDLMFFIVLATLMVPLASMIIPLFMVVKSLGWVDTYWGLILPAGTSAFGIFRCAST